MKRVMYIARTNLQIGPTDGFPSRTFRAIIGENAEVPDEIAALLVAQGHAVLVTGKPPKRPAKRKT